MPYAVLEEEIKSLPLSLQKNIESYVLSVISNYKKSSSSSKSEVSASSIIDGLTGVISDSPNLTAKEIRSMRLSERYGV